MVGSSKKIGRKGPRGNGRKMQFPSGRSFFITGRNTSTGSGGGVGTYDISTIASNAGNRTLFTHEIAGQAQVYAPLLESRMKNLSNGSGGFRIELSVQDAITGNFMDEGHVPEDADCDGGGLSFERSGAFFLANQGVSAPDKTVITSNVSVTPSVHPTICSFFFGVEFYVIFDNVPGNIPGIGISGVSITEL